MRIGRVDGMTGSVYLDDVGEDDHQREGGYSRGVRMRRERRQAGVAIRIVEGSGESCVW